MRQRLELGKSDVATEVMPAPMALGAGYSMRLEALVRGLFGTKPVAVRCPEE